MVTANLDCCLQPPPKNTVMFFWTLRMFGWGPKTKWSHLIGGAVANLGEVPATFVTSQTVTAQYCVCPHTLSK